MNAIFYIAVLLISVVIHEVSHGFAAEYFGDRTARLAGRLTLNPLKHLDPFGSIILPLLLYLSAGFAFGWARPVPYNPDNLTNRQLGTIFVASAGVLSNLCLAVIFGLIIRFTFDLQLAPDFYFITSTIVLVNLALAIFNLVPIPPLDGSKILFALAPVDFYPVLEALESYGFVLLIIFIIFFAEYLSPVLSYLFYFVTGLAF